MVSYCGTDSTTGRYFSFISRNFDPEQGCAAHAFGKFFFEKLVKVQLKLSFLSGHKLLSLVSLESSLEITAAMEKAFKQGFSSVVSFF